MGRPRIYSDEDRRERKREYMRVYRQKNKEKIKEYKREYYERNKERIRLKYQKVDSRVKRQQLREECRTLRRKVVEVFGNKCMRCPEDTYVCLDFHHINPDNKPEWWDKKRPYKMVQLYKEWLEGGISEDILILCANCHRKEHNSQKLPLHPSGGESENEN